jgi:hypothetical protein
MHIYENGNLRNKMTLGSPIPAITNGNTSATDKVEADSLDSKNSSSSALESLDVSGAEAILTTNRFLIVASRGLLHFFERTDREQGDNYKLLHKASIQAGIAQKHQAPPGLYAGTQGQGNSSSANDIEIRIKSLAMNIVEENLMIVMDDGTCLTMTVSVLELAKVF